MLHKLRSRVQDEKGFTLIELLVVILIIGILAAIALPAFLNQREKAQDATAKSDVRTTQTAMETYYTDNQTYTGADTTKLKAIEPALNNANFPATGAVTVSGTNGSAYAISVKSKGSNGVVYTINNTGGTVTRTCLPASTGGCSSTGSW
jgi:type IV pilus assembly protein PilA